MRESNFRSDFIKGSVNEHVLMFYSDENIAALIALSELTKIKIEPREFLWDNPEWIDKYITSVKLPEVKIRLLNSWRLHHKKGTFILMEYTPEHALVVGAVDNKDRVYAIKGISRALSGAVQRELPLSFESVLLPFKDKIIYDGFINVFKISYAEGAKKFLRETYDKALEAGIVSRLDQEKG